MAGFLRSVFGKKDGELAGEFLQTSAAAPELEVATAQEGVPVHVTDQTLAHLVARSPLPVLLDVWAPWCSPCRALAPIMEELAKAYSGRAVIAKLDTDENPGTATQFQILGIPTLIFFKNGREAERLVGYAPRHAIEEKMQVVLD